MSCITKDNVITFGAGAITGALASYLISELTNGENGKVSVKKETKKEKEDNSNAEQTTENLFDHMKKNSNSKNKNKGKKKNKNKKNKEENQ